ncbi:hypothetical protein LZK98_04815 [Sphingomonas cannabina]|uniref:hypothetical protein n=1 Tax=Sphingomonas cannabina TaxID=2899123 RepID=UPI001F3577F2|nr:hypothetical protein [Sphingomonas cannabina]UIJ46272.1 hypothetical protein LZK98_04815 [Sphingomonas cannabina]
MRGMLFAGAVALACAGGVAEAAKKVERSALEIQQMQSRDIEGDKALVFGAVMTVLQDAGYRIQAADKDTGLITGVSSTKSKLTYSLWSGFGKSKKSPVVSAFIEERAPGVTNVRLSFVMAKVRSTLYGSGAQDEEPIYDPAVYSDAFEKINQSVFVRKNMAASPAAPVTTPAAVTTPQ